MTEIDVKAINIVKCFFSKRNTKVNVKYLKVNILLVMATFLRTKTEHISKNAPMSLNELLFNFLNKLC